MVLYLTSRFLRWKGLATLTFEMKKTLIWKFRLWIERCWMNEKEYHSFIRFSFASETLRNDPILNDIFHNMFQCSFSPYDHFEYHIWMKERKNFIEIFRLEVLSYSIFYQAFRSNYSNKKTNKQKKQQQENPFIVILNVTIHKCAIIYWLLSFSELRILLMHFRLWKGDRLH